MFLDSLDSYEKINLFTMIEKANNPQKANWLCYSEALGTVSEGNLEHSIIETLLRTGIHS